MQALLQVELCVHLANWQEQTAKEAVKERGEKGISSKEAWLQTFFVVEKPVRGVHLLALLGRDSDLVAAHKA